MTVNQYLDLAYAVVVEEHVRRGSSLFDALELTAEFAAGGERRPVVTGTAGATASGNGTPPPPEQGIGGPGAPLTAADLANQEAMAVLTGAMGGVSGGFR
jgi:hypothetical protein